MTTIVTDIDKKRNEKIQKPKWWFTNENGKRLLLHHIIAQYLIEKHTIVRYPDAQGDLYYYNQETGLYEQDKRNRQVRAFIRLEESDFKTNQVREVQEYIMDMSPIVTEISKDYIAVNNGLLDLKTMDYRPFNPDVFLISKIPTNYNSNACDSFVDDTLKKVTDDHEPSIRNLEEMFGCVLYPKAIVPKMYYLYGATAHNGKSIIIFLLHKTFNFNGGNISAVSPQKLANNTFAGNSIYGKMANIVDDQPDQVIEDSGTLKTMITGGYVEIEGKGKESKAVEMSGTAFITASNHFPQFREHGNQINRRLHIIPFEHNFSLDPECLSDLESMKRLSTESAREYCLKLAVEAVKRMLQSTSIDRLTPNPKAVQAGEEFSEYSNPLTDYFAEFDKDHLLEIRGTDAIKEYHEWCDDNFIKKYKRLETPDFKKAVCKHYDLEWKSKRLKVNGTWITNKGFANPTKK